jgi:hypothetical protein
MNRTTYTQVIRSIRANGLHYTARIAAQNNDRVTLDVCERYQGLMQFTDWLAMRQQFARHEKPGSAFKMTTKHLPA